MLLAGPSSAVHAAVLKSVQSGTTVSSGSGVTTVNISSVDTSKSFLVFQTRHNSNRPVGSELRGRIASPTKIEFGRTTNETSTISVQWYVVEFASGVKVQRGETAQSTTNVTITPVASLSQAFVLWSKTPNDTDQIWSLDDPISCELTSTSNLRIRSVEANAEHTVWWQLVEYTNSADINVQKGNTSLTGSTLSVDVTLPTAVSPSRSFALVGFNNVHDGPDVGKRMLRAQLIDATTLRIDRSASGDDLSNVGWQVIELKDGTTTQHGSASLASGVAQSTTPISAVDVSRSIAFASVQPAGGQNMGRSPYVTDDIIGVGSVTMALTATSLQLDRASTVDSTDVGWFVVQFPNLTPANIPYATDFQSAIGAEWSNTTRTNNSTFTQFAGPYHNSSLSLALNTTIGENYLLVFDLYAIDSWEGSAASPNGPDALAVNVDGAIAFSKTFGSEWPSNGQTYLYPYDSIGSYGFETGYKDAIYRKVEVPFTATASVSYITFSGSLSGSPGAGLSDESWGIDNVSVAKARFVDASSSTGFAVTTTDAATAGSGVLWGDLDNDGDLDAILGGNSTSRVMINNNAGQSFSASTFGGGANREQMALLDFDNDGDLDVWVGEATTTDVESLFLNSGSASFYNSGNLGFTGPATTEGVAVGDVNGDGWCDAPCFATNGNYIGHHQGNSPGTFVGTNASSYGMNDSGDYGTRGMVAAGDVNNDRLPDFYYHYNSGKLFVSDGDGTYTENPHGISVSTGSSSEAGGAWGDYDGDGDLDLFVARLNEACSGYVWRNDRNWTAGTGGFTNVTASAGLNLNTVINYTPDLGGARSGAWGDYDNDGDLDLLIVGESGNHYLYAAQGDGTFQRAGEGTSLSGSFADGVFVDYDNDGDLDIAMTRINGTAVLLQNRTNNSQYLKVRLIGAGAGRTNKAAIGTRIELWDEDESNLLARRDVGVARGYGGIDSMWAHFGGVNAGKTYTLKVYFRSGIVTTTVVPQDHNTTIGSTTIPQMITITEQGGVKLIKWKEVLSTSVSP